MYGARLFYVCYVGTSSECKKEKTLAGDNYDTKKGLAYI